MKTSSKYALVSVIGIILVIAMATVGFATTSNDKVVSLAYIDSTKILSQHPIMVKVNEQLKAKATSLQSELDAKLKGADKTEQQKLLSEYQAKLDTEKQTKQEQALKKINGQIKDYARKEGFTAVLDSRAVIYGGTDITSEILKLAKSGK